MRKPDNPNPSNRVHTLPGESILKDTDPPCRFYVKDKVLTSLAGRDFNPDLDQWVLSNLRDVEFGPCPTSFGRAFERPVPGGNGPLGGEPLTGALPGYAEVRHIISVPNGDADVFRY